MSLDLSLYRPGNGYKIKEYIASGAWKSAFRARSPSVIQDIALLCYHSADRKQAIEDLKSFLRLDESPHIATFHQIFRGEDSRIWLAEELLLKSLSDLVPLNNMARFTRIARDLCRGLEVIHRHDLVHRDIKLDNCGINRFWQAKIFDLGSLVTEPGKVECTILTRPPELLLNSDSSFDAKCDVWAVGATLLALASRNYPFVGEQEVRDRAKINELLVAGEIDIEEAKKRKAIIDQVILERAYVAEAADLLKIKIDEQFGGVSRDIMYDMLHFEPDRRIGASDASERWSRVADSYAGIDGIRHGSDTWERHRDILINVKERQITLSDSQFERLVSEWQLAKTHDEFDLAFVTDIENLMTEVKSMLELRSLSTV